MITKIKANKSFRGTTKYVLEKEKAKIIGGNMYGSTTKELVEQFTLSAHLNPQLKDPCYHLMLSVPKPLALNLLRICSPVAILLLIF